MHFVRRPFQFPEPLDRALQRRFGGNHHALARALAGLWPALAQGRGQSEKNKKHYSGAAAATEAYGAYYLPANAMKLPLLLEEARVFGLPLAPEGAALRWLDVGSGPGTAYWGLAWWASHRGVKLELTGLEQSADFLRLADALARELARELPGAGPARWESFRHGAGARSLGQWIGEAKPHVVSMLNSIGEMAPDTTARAEWLGEVCEALARQARDAGEPRWLVLLEPGSKAASRELLELREALRAREDVRVWLPCLGARPCGALLKKDDWCHEEAAVRFPKWMDELGAAAGLRKEAVLFSYLICSVGTHQPAPKDWPAGGLRVVSQMMSQKGLTECFLCTEGGKRRARVLDSRVSPSNRDFTSAVRGQVFDAVELTEKGDVTRFESYAGETELDAAIFPPLR